MKPNKANTPKAADPDRYGAFMPDGSYFYDARLEQRGPTDRFIRAMVKTRGTFGFDPKTAVEAIVLAGQQAAFPNHAQWATVHERVHEGAAVWPFVWTTTSAEESVKRCGIGIRGPNDEERHWCGEVWAAGDEKHCVTRDHRSSPENVRTALDRMLSHLPSGLAPARAPRRIMLEATGEPIRLTDAQVEEARAQAAKLREEESSGKA